MDRDDNIVELYNAGNSMAKVSELTGVSTTHICRILKRNNVKSRSLRTDSKIEEEIVKLYLDGISSEVIAKQYDLEATTICRIITRNGHKIRGREHEIYRKYKVKLDVFDNIDTEEKAYFLGFMWADGNVNKEFKYFKITLQPQDEGILDKLAKIVFVDNYELYNDREYKMLYVGSTELAKKLNSLGCTPNKSHTIKFPTWLDKDLYRHFIRGLFDGDGCICKKDKIKEKKKIYCRFNWE